MAKHTIGDLDNVQRKLADWFKQNLSQREDLVVEAFNFPENTGESNVILVVDVNWNESGQRAQDKFVVRLLLEGAKVFDDYKLTRRSAILPIVCRAALRYAIIMERVFARMLAKGEQRMDNFVVPIVKELHEKARASR